MVGSPSSLQLLHGRLTPSVHLPLGGFFDQSPPGRPPPLSLSLAVRFGSLLKAASARPAYRYLDRLPGRGASLREKAPPLLSSAS